jgi:hypothetical protein
MRRRNLRAARYPVAVLAITAVGAVAWLVASGSGRSAAQGPLPVTDRIEISMPLGVGETATWGMPLPGSSNGTAVLRRIEPIGARDIEIVAIQTCRSSGTPDAAGDFVHCAPLGAAWPPAGVDLLPVEGMSVQALADPFVDVVIGVRRPSPADGRIDALRILYAVGDVEYETVEPWSLTVASPTLD